MKKISILLLLTTLVILLASITAWMPLALLSILAVTILIIEVANYLPTVEKDGFHSSHFHYKGLL